MFRPTSITGCILGVAIAYQPFSSYAFSTTGGTWPNDVAVLTLNPISFPAGNVFNDNAQFAMSDWNAVIGSNFQFLVNSFDCATRNLGDGVNCVSFVAGGVLNGALAVTSFRNSGSTTVNADVRFDVTFPWVAGVNVDDFSVGNPFSFRGVARHEFGHVLGLCHEDRLNNVVLMNSRYTAGGVKPVNPHWDDRLGVRTLYRAAGAERDLAAYMWKMTTNEIAGCASAAGNPIPVNDVSATVSPGSSINLEYSFENAGNFASGDFDIAFLLSTNTIISNADTQIGLNVGAFAPAHSRGTFNRALTIPSNMPPGTYSIGICLDPSGSVRESHEFNNCERAPGTITVSGST